MLGMFYWYTFCISNVCCLSGTINQMWWKKSHFCCLCSFEKMICDIITKNWYGPLRSKTASWFKLNYVICHAKLLLSRPEILLHSGKNKESSVAINPALLQGECNRGQKTALKGKRLTAAAVPASQFGAVSVQKRMQADGAADRSV